MRRLRRISSLPFATLSVLFASVFLFGSTVSAQSLTEVRPLSQNEQIIQQQAQEMADKAGMLNLTSLELEQLESKKATLAQQLETEKKLIEELKQKIANKKAAEAKAAQEAVAAPVRTVSYSAQVNTAPVGNCGDNYYASYIYGMESGGRVVGNCSTTARNAGGCYGIGQACPGSKVAHCGADYACQNEWFTGYALGRYGSWAAAYNFHKANGWW